MYIHEDIILRPRFKRDLSLTRDAFIARINKHKEDKIYIISAVDDHVFIRIPKKRSHFWSPELHLEIQETANKKLYIKGLYGPKPTVWTMFMFLHFVVAGLFIASGIWLYTRYTLDKSLRVPIILMILMTLVWVTLYISGRMGRKTGENQMRELHNFLNKILTG
jgi:hypothetical protein